MASFNDKPKDEPEPQLQKEGEILIGLDQRLADLLQLGWTLVAESCPLETCRCPLLRSFDGNKYCVRCEMWIFDKENKKEKFTDLVVKGIQDLQVKDQGLTKLPKKIFDFSNTAKETMLSSLKMKLAYLSSILNDTTNLNKTQSILQNIKTCIEDIKMINESI